MGSLKRSSINFSEFLEKGIHSDVTFDVVDSTGVSKLFNCHKLLFSATSRYFRNMLTSGGTGNAKKPTTPLQLKLEHTTFDYLLEFVYSGEVLVAEDQFKEFWAALTAFEMVQTIKKDPDDQPESEQAGPTPSTSQGPPRKRIKKEHPTMKQDPDAQGGGEDEEDKKPNLDLKPQFVPTEDGRFRCLNCDKTFSFLRSAKTHYREIHSESTADHICPICQTTFKIKRYLQVHIKQRHNLTQKQLNNSISF